MFVLGLIFVIIGAICDSIRDAIMAKDVFGMYGEWWYWKSWKNKYKYKNNLYRSILVFITDAWHTFKYLYVFFSFIGSVIMSYYSNYGVLY